MNTDDDSECTESRCEGCGAIATTHDNEGVPLCEECANIPVHESDQLPPPKEEYELCKTVERPWGVDGYVIQGKDGGVICVTTTLEQADFILLSVNNHDRLEAENEQLIILVEKLRRERMGEVFFSDTMEDARSVLHSISEAKKASGVEDL